ncbi:PREDICTED: uncharacterized protein LOC108564198, partial [Nicrophorus vespilloides]|uniref:Uncharacterized protein LOC108564198 n=1 Tax=Nicrophorus vespilloides TaxID=110193 RepID=A0ABM1MVP0_NICVS
NYNNEAECQVNEEKKTNVLQLDNQEDVLKAAKSLFSKRTRTLYHWMYPNTPKFHLKSAVALAWDMMGPQEKQFYISQVLGKFGYLQNSLMVNPQLGGLTLPFLPIPPQTEVPDLGNVETRNAVSNLLQENPNTWPQSSQTAQTLKRRGRPRGSNKRSSKTKPFRNRKQYLRANEGMDDFTDDPELRKELEQFQWALHMVDK